MNKKILLVEYDPPVIDTIKELLSHPILEITTAPEGESAKTVLENKSFDLVITAAMLPKFHGFNLSRYISEHFPGTRVVIMSGIYKAIEYRHQAIGQYHAQDFFEKPLDKQKFKSRVLELLEIGPADLSQPFGPATAPLPVVDTAQIPAIKKTYDRKSNFSSDDLFGDIIKKIEEKPLPPKQGPKPLPHTYDEEVEILMDPAQNSQPTQQKQKSPSQLLDSDLNDLLLNDQREKDTRRFKKIEDDISRRFEETLSGLGLNTGNSAKKRTQTASTQTMPTPPAPPQPVPDSQISAPPPKPGVLPEEKYEFDNYDILGLIARGGMAEIYKAKKKGVKGFEKIIAIKKILSGYGEDDKYIEMFVDEAKIAAELTHPNIVQIYDLGKKDDYYFIAMEYVHGKDLRLLIKRLSELSVRIPEELAVYLILKILEALGYAHSAKDSHGNNLEIVHRDISPPNILLSYSGDVKLTDFGVSKARIKMHQTVSGALKGKLLYMSPEQARGERDIDSRSDLYSVGVILYELITGEKLFMDTSEILILKRVQEGFVLSPSELIKDIDPQLERIILKTLAKNRWERYQSASEVINELENYLRNKYDHIPASIHMAHFLFKIFQEEIKKKGIKVDLKALPYEIKPLSISRPEFTPFQMDDDEDRADAKKTSDTQELEQEDLEEGFEPSVEINFDEIDHMEKPDDPAEKIAPPKQTEIFLPEYETDPGERKGIGVDLDLTPKPKLGSSQLKQNDNGITPSKPESIPETFELDAEIAALEKEAGRKSLKAFLLIFAILVIAGATAYYFLVLNKQETQKVATPQQTETVDPGTQQETAPGIETSEDRSTEEQATPDPVPTETSPPPQNKTEARIDEAPKAKPEKAAQQSAASVDKPKEAPKEAQLPVKEETPPEETLELPSSQDKQAVAQDIPAETTVQPENLQKKPEIKEGMVTADIDSQPVPIETSLPKIPRKITKSLANSETVIVSYLVDHRGNVERIKFVRKSQSDELNMLLMGSINNWKFQPAMREGKKVKFWMTKPITIKK